MLKGVSTALRLFDKFAVGYTSSRPSLWGMVGVELEKSSSATRDTADDDVFFVVAAFLDRIHGSPEHINGDNRFEVAHSPGMGSGNLGSWDQTA